MLPQSEMVHWWFASGFLVLALLNLSKAVVGTEIWDKRPWRRYLWPGMAFLMGVLMWPVMTFFTNSTIHMLAHGSWAEVLMLAGATELGLARGKLKSPYWKLTTALAFLVSGAAFLIHEQNPWLFQRSAFIHHALGWTLLLAAIFPLLQALRPRSMTANFGLAATFFTVAIFLFSDRDIAPIFGHLSTLAGIPRR